MELKINKELEEIIPKLSPEEYEALKNSIKEKGLLKPIDVMSDGTIVDGHHRYKACKELGIDPIPYAVMPNLKTIQDALEYSFNINFPRRHLNLFQKAKWAYEVKYKAEKEKALARKTSGKPWDKLAQGRAAEIVAKQVGISKATFEKVRRIIEKAPKEFQGMVKDELISIDLSDRLVKALENEDYPVPEKTKKSLYQEVIDAKDLDRDDRAKAFNAVLHKVEQTTIAKSLLANTAEKIAKSLEKKYKDLYYTEDLKSDDVDYDIKKAEGANIELKKVFLSGDTFANEQEADAYFKKYGGRSLGKQTVELWVGEVDPHRWKKREEK